MIDVRILHQLKDNDGITLKDGKIINYKSGWQVADFGKECKTIPEALQAIKEYNGTCGVWFSNGIYYVDHSIRVNTKQQALAIGRAHNQISIWGWKNQKLVYC